MIAALKFKRNCFKIAIDSKSHRGPTEKPIALGLLDNILLDIMSIA